MTLHMQLRTKKEINWRELCFGQKIFIKEERIVPQREILPNEYRVERLISRKLEKRKELMYMVKWEGYSVYECSWEPEAHLNQVLLNTFYTPEIDDSRLALSARNFELAIQQRLRGKHNTVIIRFDLDVFRHCFGIENSYILQSVDDFEKLPLHKNWHYNLNASGRGLKIAFPLTVKPKLHMKKVYISEKGTLEMKTVPVETLRMICAIEVCTFDQL
ncbi:unnamed protein product [Mytilus edulis]|uniref:Chromo domain-containing protein n=1 Tax=Mytilus edulis TaxID=6550 RepID=A0A8S3SNW2_MYTED|nr:unnamed protein product [Mytilus edulis]